MKNIINEIPKDLSSDYFLKNAVGTAVIHVIGNSEKDKTHETGFHLNNLLYIDREKACRRAMPRP
jgi:hypothetical protein